MELGSILGFFGILALSAFFSGTETALTAVSPLTIRHLAERGHPRAAVVDSLIRDRARVIATLLVGNNIVNVALAVLATLVFDNLLSGSGLLPFWAGPLAASATSIGFLLVFGEVLPKSIAVTFPVRWALASAWPVRLLMWSFLPASWVLMRLSRATVRLLGHRSGAEDAFGIREIHALARMGEQAGVIDRIEGDLIQRASELNDTRVREIMMPRTDIQGVPADIALAELRRVFEEELYTRMPVYLGDLDDILGIVNFKEILRIRPEDAANFDLRRYMHPALFVPEAMFIGALLEEMRKKRTHLAIVIDEYGGTSGLVSLEDVVEMLVGHIDDEYDVQIEPIRQKGDHEWLVDGRTTLEQLEPVLGIELSQEMVEGANTAAGLALKAFGKIPAEGETIAYHRLELKVLRVREHRVRRLHVRLLSEPVEESGKSRRRTEQLSAGGPAAEEKMKEKTKGDGP